MKYLEFAVGVAELLKRLIPGVKGIKLELEQPTGNIETVELLNMTKSRFQSTREKILGDLSEAPDNLPE